MLQKIAITSIEQFDKSVNDARSIVIYGSRSFGRLAVDHLIEMGNRDKIAAIVHTKGSKYYPQTYRQIPIRDASAFFAQPEHKDVFVIISVTQPKFWDEIFETLEFYGVQICAYLAQMMLAPLAKSADGNESHSDMRSYIFTEGQLCDLMDNATEAVIYGSEEWGDRLVKYLEQVGRGLKIRETGKRSMLSSPADPIGEGTLVLVAPFFDVEILLGEIKTLNPKRHYFCTPELMERLSVLLKNKFQGEVAQGISFVVAGSPKCGTTSLHFALQKIEDIYLPDDKESGFFLYRFSDRNLASLSKENWLRRFYNHVPKGSVTGTVEPTFALFPREIRETLGSDLKVCFLMRNPVDVIYAGFKMVNRTGQNSSWFRYDQYGKYCEEMFDDFITALSEQKRSYFEYSSSDLYVRHFPANLYYEYANILEEFLRYYPMKQIKVVIFEELIREPEEKVNEILRFVGSKKVYDSQLGFPKEETEDFVWVDQESRMLSWRRFLLLEKKRKQLKYYYDLNDPEDALARANEIQNEILSLTRQLESAERIFSPKMTPEQRKRLEDFYRPSVRKLEKMLGKDLSKLWFE